MKHWLIEPGMKLIMKPARCEAYGMSKGAIVEVASLRSHRAGYAMPWVYDYNGYAFKPTDFVKAI